jgi:hypothetical protein
MRWITGLIICALGAASLGAELDSAWSGYGTDTHLASKEIYPDDEDDPDHKEAPPIIPDIEGFGINTYAGSGRHRRPFNTNVMRISRLDDAGRGTLRECVEYRGPRTCVFEVGGEIKLRSALKVRSPYLTIAGQTAPNPGITLTGGTLRVETNDVLVQHIAVRPGDAQGGVQPSYRDGIAIGVESPGSAHHIVLDHVSVTWALDENISTWYRTTRNVTISNSIIAEGLDNSIHPKGAHSKGLMIGDGTRRVSVVRNLIANNIERNPYLKPGTTVEFVNNVVYGWGPDGGWSLCNVTDNVGRGEPIMLSFIGNFYKPGPWSFIGAPVYGKKLASGTRIFAQGNIGPTRKSDAEEDWKIASLPTEPYRASSPPFRGARVRKLPAQQAYERVLQTVGSRPRRRSPVDARIVEDVRAGRGGIKDCLNGCPNAVGTIEVEQSTTSKLSLPSDLFALTDKSGYTRLEKWLQGRAKEIE